MLKDFLKNTARGILSGNGTKESAKEGAKKTAKNMAVKGAKNVAKKGLKKALTVIMIPWGCVITFHIRKARTDDIDLCTRAYNPRQ